jgi:hypothetical protein
MSNYIDNKRFEELIVEYDPENQLVSNELFEMFDTLIERLIAAYRFKIEKDDAKQECLVLILRILNKKRFDKERGKAFNYLTTVILNNLRLMFTKNKKYAQKIEDYSNIKLGVPLSNDRGTED